MHVFVCVFVSSKDLEVPFSNHHIVSDYHIRFTVLFIRIGVLISCSLQELTLPDSRISLRGLIDLDGVISAEECEDKGFVIEILDR